MARMTSAVVALTWREHGRNSVLEQDGHERGRTWAQGNVWIARFGGTDSSSGGRNHPSLGAAREALVLEAETRVLDLLSDGATAALRQAGLLP
ncbi:hypothetical protein DFR29_12816 [Tahibacter aquaticus]|uniref:Uncharacterized protein n=1 Tax=Tahibacter aquaticus TaxID=520092 RepID=A0A4R6YID9_9GAMM|nr:hypothetical protein [Tahibacter aquaticus]TDR36595.1 hypothetical protein DFR29_12816 [Tahibacter aquaticus]